MISLERIERWILNILQLFGYPVLDENAEDQNSCNNLSFNFTLAVFIISSLIFLMPSKTSQVLIYKLSYTHYSPMLFKITGALTSNFVHADIFHLLGNIYMFIIFAPLVEKKYGPKNFYLAFIFCAIFSSLFAGIFLPKSSCVGLSGTVYGFMGLIAMSIPDLKFRMFKILILPCWFLILLVFVMPEISAQIKAIKAGRIDQVSHYGHIFGAIAGVILNFLLLPVPQKAKQA